MFLNLANVPQDLESQDTTFFHVWHEIDRNENEHFSRVQFNVIPTFG